MDEDQRDAFDGRLTAFHQAHVCGDVQEAESIALQCLSLATDESEEEQHEHLRLVDEAREHVNAGRWEQAETAHRDVLALAEVAGNLAMVYKAHDDLRAFYAMRGMPDKALIEACTAVEVARKVDMIPVIGMALEGLSRCYLSVGDLDAATTTAEELVDITPLKKMYELLRARALIMRAQCRLERGVITEAQDDLDIAWQLLAPQAKALIFAGVQSALASWWELTAEIKTLEKDAGAAVQAMAKAVEFRRTTAQLPQLAIPYTYHALAQVLQRYGVVLLAADDIAAATAAFTESQAIQRRIGFTLPEVFRGDLPI